MKRNIFYSLILLTIILTGCKKQDTNTTTTACDYSPYLEFTVNNNVIKGIALPPYMEGTIKELAINAPTNLQMSLVFDFVVNDSIPGLNPVKYVFQSLALYGVTSSSLLLNNLYNANNSISTELVTPNTSGAYFLYISSNPTNYCNVLFTNKKFISCLGRYVLSGVINAKLKNAYSPYDTIIVSVKFTDIGFIK